MSRNESSGRACLVVATVLAIGAMMAPGCGGAFHARESRAAEWYSLTTPHVRLETDVGSREARDTVWALEALHGALAQVFVSCPRSAPGERTEVTLFATAEDYAAIAPPGSIGFFSPAESGLVATPARIVLPAQADYSRGAVIQTYAHELTHRLVEECLPGAPAWLDEGLATYFETLRVGEDDVLEGIPPHRFGARGAATFVRIDGMRVEQVEVDRVPSATALLAMSRPAFYESAATASANRAGAWAMVHMLLTGPDAELSLRFERALSASSDGGGDLTSRLGAVLEELDLDAMLSSYVRAEPSRRRVPYTAGALGEPIAERLEVAHVNLRWAELFARSGARSQARAHARLAERSPAFEVRALLRLASTTAGIERSDLVARAEAIAPGAREVLGARAWIALEENVSTDERIELLHELGSLADPSAVELARWADLARLNGDAQPAVAISERAVELAPTSWESHASLALSLASVHRYVESDAAFERALLLTSHHLPHVARQLERLIEQIGQLLPRPPGDLPPADDAEVAALDVAQEPMVLVTGTTEATLDARRFGGTCVGFVGAEPTAVFEVPPDSPALALYAHASGDSVELNDTVLVVETSTGALRCDDDSGGWPDPGIFAQLPPGRTRVWVGTYERERAGTPFTLTLAHQRTLGRQPLPSVCGLDTEYGSVHGPVVVGARVVLGRHTPVSGGGDDSFHEVGSSTNWMPEMESFVGREATVTQLEDQDGAGCAIVRVDADAGTWLWRVRDMSRPAH